MKYYHASRFDRFENFFLPRIPESCMDGEDTETRRVCFGPTISKCLTAIQASELGIYTIYIADFDAYFPTETQVPDIKYTGEVWALSIVKIKKIGKIVVLKQELIAETETFSVYRYYWRWINKRWKIKALRKLNSQSNIKNMKARFRRQLRAVFQKTKRRREHAQSSVK